MLDMVESGEAMLPEASLAVFAVLIGQWRRLGAEIARLTAMLIAQAKGNETVRRLMAVPGVGPVIASVFALKIEDLRPFLVLGAATVLMRARRAPESASSWVAGITRRRPFNVAAVALAARMARTLWALLKHGTPYEPRHASAARAG